MHEAGHAVVHWLFRHQLVKIVVEPSGGGWCRLADDQHRDGDTDSVVRAVVSQFLMQKLISDAAGKAVEDRRRGFVEQDWQSGRCGGDYERAVKTALHLSGGSDRIAAEHLVRWGECMARMIIERHWLKVERLAAAAVKKQKATGINEFYAAEILQVLSGRP
jgi:hypothetical protein